MEFFRSLKECRGSGYNIGKDKRTAVVVAFGNSARDLWIDWELGLGMFSRIYSRQCFERHSFVRAYPIAGGI